MPDSFVETSALSVAAQKPTAQPDSAKPTAAPLTDAKPLSDQLRTSNAPGNHANGEALQHPLSYDIKDNRKKEFQQAFADGKIKTLISQQKQARHVRGTKEFAVYAEKMAAKGDAPSYIREDLTNYDLERMVVAKLKGNVLVTGKDTYREFVDCDEVIGYYYSKKAGGYVETKRVQVTYAPQKGNIHIIPVKEVKND